MKKLMLLFFTISLLFIDFDQVASNIDLGEALSKALSTGKGLFDGAVEEVNKLRECAEKILCCEEKANTVEMIEKEYYHQHYNMTIYQQLCDAYRTYENCYAKNCTTLPDDVKPDKEKFIRLMEKCSIPAKKPVERSEEISSPKGQNNGVGFATINLMYFAACFTIVIKML
ncbi:hypothetical protein DdX_21093 [Ditylenchus destructor]|uniref:Uncharacterized protein n=1 Tax=Ditylenchus destructor TaxID=166010 RepID=A0AAD4MHU4_9BILA|nr:hypothetical protein DdX_21093 [Ditylenchus destructor]